MTAPAPSPCAELVRSLDPDLFHTALFAPEPARGRLLVLYAYDIELSRAAVRASEPLIARMRLQWWRDLVAGIAAGDPPRAHEVAGPLHALLSARPLPADDLDALVGARELELDGAMDAKRFGRWLDGRFGALTRLAAHLLAGGDPAARRAASAVGQAAGTAFAIRTAAPMAVAGAAGLLPDLGPDDRAALARGRTTDHARATVRGLAGQALDALAAARTGRRAVPGEAVPALLPARRAERVLNAAIRPGFGLAQDVDAGLGGGVALAWRALTGRW